MTDNTETVSARRKRQADTVPFLTLGFRPFFLFAGLWAAFGLPLSILLMEGIVPLSGPIDVLAWHRHEMLFGFAAATVTGFILTAVPNWTGRLPVSGMPLLCHFWLPPTPCSMPKSPGSCPAMPLRAAWAPGSPSRHWRC